MLAIEVYFRLPFRTNHTGYLDTEAVRPGSLLPQGTETKRKRMPV